MTTPNPACLVGGSPTPADVSAGATVNGGLADATGVLFWTLSCISTDETTTAAAINATLALNQTSKTFSYTAPAGLGTKTRFRSTVGVNSIGKDANDVTQAAYTTTFVVNVKAANGLRVWCFDETLEQDSSFGSIVEFNQMVRAATSGAGPFSAVQDGNNADVTVTSTTQNVLVRMRNLTADKAVTLPSTGTIGQTVTVKSDATGATYPVTIAAGATNIDGMASVTLSGANAVLRFAWAGTGTPEWSVV